MKKILFSLLVCSLFIACDNDEYAFNDNIIGTWIPVIEETEIFPVNKNIYIFNSDKTGTIKYITFTDKNTYSERFSLKMDNIFFETKNEISITSDTYLVKDDESIEISTENKSTFKLHIDYLSSDSLVFIHNNKKLHYIK